MSVPMPEGVTLSQELPQEVRLSIADAVVLFGRLEQEAIEISWLRKDADLKQRLALTRNSATDNFMAIITSFEKAENGLKLDGIKEGIVGLATERNLIVHGSWAMVNDKPWVVWHKFLEDTDSIVGDYFEPWRFERFMKIGEHLLWMLRQYHNLLERITNIKTSAMPRG